MEKEEERSIITPHVLMFPLPIQSTINSNLQLAEILCLAGLRVTFLNTNHNQQRLVGHSNVQSRFQQYPQFQFLTISDGLPENHPRSAEQFGDIICSLQIMAEPFLKQILLSDVTCVVINGLFYYAIDIGNDMGVPVILFDTISPSCFWIYLCLPKLIQARLLPVQGSDLDALITHIPAMEGILRGRDLPHFCLLDYKTDQSAQAVFKKNERIPKAHGLILNSFEDLDGPFLSSIRSYIPKTYAIGPLQLNLKARLTSTTTKAKLSSSNSLWEEDHTSIKWLDAQSIGSVIYVSFGSLAVLSRNEILEFWHGLLNSKVKFLWVMRPNMLKGGESHDQFMEELVEGCKGIGYIVSWAPQEMVLAHPSVGGFLTHSGWNSTLESVIEGKPMICWPQYVDQRVTSRLVQEFWKIGLDMKDICDRFVVEKMVKDLMGTKKDEYKKSVEKLSQLAKLSVQEGGLSYHSLDCLINDIKGLARSR